MYWRYFSIDVPLLLKCCILAVAGIARLTLLALNDLNSDLTPELCSLEYARISHLGSILGRHVGNHKAECRQEPSILAHNCSLRFPKVQQARGHVKHSRGGVRDGDRWVPTKVREQAGDAGGLGQADEQGEAAGGCDQAGGHRQGGVEALDRAQGYYVGLGSWEIFSATGEHIDIRQCKRSGHFAQEGDFLVIRLDEGQTALGRPELDG